MNITNNHLELIKKYLINELNNNKLSNAELLIQVLLTVNDVKTGGKKLMINDSCEEPNKEIPLKKSNKNLAKTNDVTEKQKQVKKSIVTDSELNSEPDSESDPEMYSDSDSYSDPYTHNLDEEIFYLTNCFTIPLSNSENPLELYFVNKKGLTYAACRNLALKELTKLYNSRSQTADHAPKSVYDLETREEGQVIKQGPNHCKLTVEDLGNKKIKLTYGKGKIFSRGQKEKQPEYVVDFKNIGKYIIEIEFGYGKPVGSQSYWHALIVQDTTGQNI